MLTFKRFIVTIGLIEAVASGVCLLAVITVFFGLATGMSRGLVLLALWLGIVAMFFVTARLRKKPNIKF